MTYVSNMDIIAAIENEINFVQGNSQTYEIFLFKDVLNNSLNLSKPTSIKVAVWNMNEQLLQYTSPFMSGVSGELNLDLTGNTGKIDFTITMEQGYFVTPGHLFAEVKIIYENFYPQPKTYTFDKFKIGQAISDGNNPDVENPTQPTKEPPTRVSSIYMLEHIDNDVPSTIGRMSFDSSIPAEVTKIKFSNVDSRSIRAIELENLLENRIKTEGSNATITIFDNGDSNLFAIYKIVDWQRLDVTQNGNYNEDFDAIELTVKFENVSSGSSVTQSQWLVGDEISYRTDVYGITSNQLLQDGILTYADKNINPTVNTNGNGSTTGAKLTYSPYYDSYVMVEVNGVSVELGDGTKDKDVYFSSNGGATATRIEEIRAGDELIWNGIVTGYELTLDDEINFIYEVDVDQLR